MSETEPQPTAPPPRPPFQFTLRALLLLFVVLASSLAVFGGWGIVVFGLVVGVAIYLNQIKSWWSLTYLALAALCLMCLMPAVATSHVAGNRAACGDNLKHIAMALHKYRQANGCFPPAYIADKNGKPMHSWRVLILPYLDQDALYKAYDFTEPWDGPTNKKLLALRRGSWLVAATPTPASGVPVGQAILRWWGRTQLGRAKSRGNLATLRARPPTPSCLSKRPSRASSGRNRRTCRWKRWRGRDHATRAVRMV